MKALLGWDSASSVVAIHATLEGVALLFFAALVVFDILAHLNKKRQLIFERIGLMCFGIAVLAEIVAYPYSRRNDVLSAEVARNADKRIADLNKKAQDAAKETAQLQKDAEGLKKQTEDERLARVKIERQLQPRRLTPKQQSTISSLLARYAGKNVEVQSYTSDIEAAILAEQIAAALRVATITVRDSIATINAASLPILFGVHVDTNSPDRESAMGVAGILRDNSSVAVISDEVRYGPGTLRFIAPGPRPDVIILVGVKPLRQ